jgi:anaphase-promoting complex subunit 1
MVTIQPVPIRLDGRLAAPTAHFLRRDRPEPDPRASNLLKAIRTTLESSRGPIESIHSEISPSYHTTAEEEELCWDDSSVTLSVGGIIIKRWNFTTEKQPVQCACIGWFEQSNSVFTSPNVRSGSYTDDEDIPDSTLPDPSQRPTFGPFSRQTRDSKPHGDTNARSRAVFVFLRSIGKVYVLNGLEYTFHLPFIVRKAWALSPHGIMMQRVLDKGELADAKISGDEPLPTLFTMVNPFAEAAVVGLGYVIKNGVPAPLEDVDQEKAAGSIPAQEEVLWVSNRSSDSIEQIFVTIDKDSRTASVWRYVYVHSNSYSFLTMQAIARPNAKNRLSLSSPLSPRRSSMQRSNLSPELPPEPPQLGSLSGMASSLEAAIPMAAIVPGAVPNTPWTNVPPSLKDLQASNMAPNRSEVPFKVEKPVVGARGGPSTHVDPVETARMRPAYCVEKLHSVAVSIEE